MINSFILSYLTSRNLSMSTHYKEFVECSGGSIRKKHLIKKTSDKRNLELNSRSIDLFCYRSSLD